ANQAYLAQMEKQRQEERERKQAEDAEATAEKKAIPKGPPQKGAAAPPPPTASIPVPEGFNPAAFEEELDAEDLEFLGENIRKLLKAPGFEYDASTGLFT